MATLEEIAQQFEDALETDTGTTIAPGTVAPVGVTAGGRKKLSWPEVVQKMAENTGLGKKELLPDVPKGVTSQSFYRAGARSGLLPQGLATFTSSPFGSFQGRMGVAQGTKKDPDTTTEQSAVPAPVVAPLSAPQRQEQGWTSMDERQMALDNLDPVVDPNKGFADLVQTLIPTGTIKTAVDSFNKKDKLPTYFDFSTFTSEQIDSMIESGLMNEEQAHQYSRGIHRMNAKGRPVSKQGKEIDRIQYHEELEREEENNIAFKILRKGGNLLGIKSKVTPPMYKPGYQNDGTYVSPGGTVSAMGTWNGLLGLVDKTVAEKEGMATPTLNSAQKALSAIKASEKRFALFKMDPDLVREVKAKANALLGSRKPAMIKNENVKISTTKKVAPALLSEDTGGEDLSGEAFASGQAYADTGMEDWTYFNEGGRVAMQEGGEAMQMPQPQGGQEAEMANLGIVNEQAAPPQDGGQQSVKDDIPREADEGDYILPYETVLQVGLKQLNRYAKEAIQLAIKNNVNLKGTDLDPSDDVPIKISNYEYHIPKGLVPYFGGGKKYLDKIRNEGLALRKRLEEEKQPPAQQQQPMEAAPEPAPAPQPQMVADAQPAPQAPQMPMMQTGGFVDDPVKALKSAEQALTSDTSQPTQSAYNQVQALEQAKQKSQQPPMVDPTGKVVQQGFAAPQGFALGGDVEIPSESDVQEIPEESQNIPASQMDTSANPLPETQIAMSDQEKRRIFQKAFKENRQQGNTQFELDGKKYSTGTKEELDIMKRFRNLDPVTMLALVALGEARGEGPAGMQAVMHVIHNRAKANRPGEFGGTDHRSVMLHPNAFSSLRGYFDPKERKNFLNFMMTKTDDKYFKQAEKLATQILNEELEDITHGALYYYNPEKVRMPKYLEGKQRKTTVGDHVFFNQGGFVDRVIDTAAA